MQLPETTGMNLYSTWTEWYLGSVLARAVAWCEIGKAWAGMEVEPGNFFVLFYLNMIIASSSVAITWSVASLCTLVAFSLLFPIQALY